MVGQRVSSVQDGGWPAWGSVGDAAGPMGFQMGASRSWMMLRRVPRLRGCPGPGGWVGEDGAGLAKGSGETQGWEVCKVGKQQVAARSI